MLTMLTKVLTGMITWVDQVFSSGTSCFARIETINTQELQRAKVTRSW